ncbi:MAG: PD40 domain-containing protein [Anaerolineales bacterium]|nr:PD40 domain-containing protein [Anaerolineales bacterium]
MNKNFRFIVSLLVLTATALACALPIGTGDSEPTTDQVATIVAGTLQALTPVSSTVVPDAPSATPAPAGILPRSLYYIGSDGSGLAQVFRVERDGVTTRQITFEPSNVSSFDVSPIDGSMAYVANNQLLSINADGSGRSLLVDGGVVDPNNQMSTSISNPVFSPDGLTIAYGLRGLNLYSIIGGTPTTVLPQQVDASTGMTREMYVPKNYSPDGTKILITVAIPNSDGISSGIYVPATNSLVRISGEGAIFCCAKQGWTPDSAALFSANPSLGMFGSGLWRVDAVTGAITTLIPSDAGSGAYNLPDEPYLAPDGQLYYFFSAAPSPDGFINRAPLQIVRSAPDGVTGRTVLNPEGLQLINEVLWAPDASFVIIVFAPMQDVYVGGQAEVTYYDGRPPVILTTYAQDLKWGP